MNRRLLSSFLCGCFVVFPCLCAMADEENFILMNGNTGEIVVELGPQVNERFSPCSTFKVPLSLMGYDAGILIDENTPVWDFEPGYDDWLETWRGPQTPQSWMTYSCVWYSKILAILMGSEMIQDYVDAFEYGNQDISGGLPQPGPVDPFWINSSLKISLREQVEFLQKVYCKYRAFSALNILWENLGLRPRLFSVAPLVLIGRKHSPYCP